jgi:hypothetical protein
MTQFRIWRVQTNAFMRYFKCFTCLNSFFFGMIIGISREKMESRLFKWHQFRLLLTCQVVFFHLRIYSSVWPSGYSVLNITYSICNSNTKGSKDIMLLKKLEIWEIRSFPPPRRGRGGGRAQRFCQTRRRQTFNMIQNHNRRGRFWRPLILIDLDWSTLTCINQCLTLQSQRKR